MRKAILNSIRPKWCKLIASGEKTVEIRKTKPNAILPLKCYIYETLGDERAGNAEYNYIKKGYGRGKVIGEFVCHNIFPVWPGYIVSDGLTFAEQEDYLGERGRGWGWTISNLVIYDTPKEVNEFWRLPCERISDCGNCRKFDRENMACTRPPIITRPPQSWCYVEENT